MVGMTLVESLYVLPTWTRTVRLVAEHAALRKAIGPEMRSVHLTDLRGVGPNPAGVGLGLAVGPLGGGGGRRRGGRLADPDGQVDGQMGLPVPARTEGSVMG